MSEMISQNLIPRESVFIRTIKFVLRPDLERQTTSILMFPFIDGAKQRADFCGVLYLKEKSHNLYWKRRDSVSVALIL